MGIVTELRTMGITLGPPDKRGVRNGPCPLCGGTDRFAVWTETNTFKCNQCEVSGNLRGFFQHIMKLDPSEAAARARESATEEEPEVIIDEDRNHVADSDRWTRFILSEIEAGEELLAKRPETMKWLLKERGLRAETVRKMRLGLEENCPWLKREACGLRPYQKPDGKWVRKLKIPDGILIRWAIRDEGTIGLQVRCWEATYGRYRSVEGSRLEATFVKFFSRSREDVLVVVESMLDAALIHQETTIPVLALGGVNAPIGDEAWRALERTPLVLLLMDGDDAGEKAARQFKATFPHAYRVSLPWDADEENTPKDITEAWRERGLNVSKFIAAAIRLAERELRGTTPPAHPPAVKPRCESSSLSAKRRSLHLIAEPAKAAEAIRNMAELNDMLGVCVSVAGSGRFPEHPKTGISPSLSRLRLVQISGREGDAFAIDAFACARHLREILAPLSGKALVAFDGVTLMCHLIHAGLLEKTPDCCMLQWNALTNETAKTLTFESVLKRTLGIEVPREDSLPDWGRRSLEPAQLERAASRVMHLVRLHEALATRLHMKSLDQVYLRMHSAQRVVARLMLRGIGFDAEAHAALVEGWKSKAETLERELRSIAGPDINFDSGAQVSYWLRRVLPRNRVASWPETSGGDLRTAAAVLEENSDLDVVALLLRHSRLRDLLSRYGDNMAAFFDPVTRRMHAEFNLAGAVTGRLSSARPNLHSIPRRGGLRDLFKAERGRVLVCADFSQIDLRVAALLSKDRRMLEAYRKGEDFHRQTAALVLSIRPEDVTPEQRQMAKAVSFGTLYGQSGAGLRDYAKAEYKVQLTGSEASSMQKRLFDAYPQLAGWREDRCQSGRRMSAARTHGGRSRSFEEGEERSEQRSLNTPVQGTAGEIMLKALVLVDSRLDGSTASVVNTVHDDIMVECAEGEADTVENILRESMTEAMLAMFPEAPTLGLVECGIGNTWADTK